MERRDYKDPRYVKWRKGVYARDKYKCQFPGCNCDKNLNAHHIKRWANYPALRYIVSNGITLCKVHHKHVTGREEEFENTFSTITNKEGNDVKLELMLLRYKK